MGVGLSDFFKNIRIHKSYCFAYCNYRKIPIICPWAYICSNGLFVIFLETLYGILGEGAYFWGAYYPNVMVYHGCFTELCC